MNEFGPEDAMFLLAGMILAFIFGIGLIYMVLKRKD